MIINNLKCCLLVVAMTFCFQVNAQLVFRTAFMSWHPTPDCYKLRITVLQLKPEFQMTFAAEGVISFGNDSCFNGKKDVMGMPEIDCNTFKLNGATISTLQDAPRCLQEYVNDDASKEALQASIDFSLGHLKGFKGMKTSVVRGLLAYPIPAHNYLNIATGFTAIRDAMLVITDVSGKKVFHMHLQNPGSEAFTLCTKEFKPGYYFLTISSNENELAKQTIIVQ